MLAVPYPAMESILHHLKGDSRALSRCSLVSHYWTSPSQRALFGSRCFVVGTDIRSTTCHIRDEVESRLSTMTFRQIVDVAPHLIGYITRLVYQLEPRHSGSTLASIPDMLQPLTGLSLPNMVSLTLRSNENLVCFLHRANEQLATSFRALTQLRLHRIQFTSLSAFACLVRSFPSITSLVISQVYWDPRKSSETPRDGTPNLQLLSLGLEEQPVISLLEPVDANEQLIAWLLGAIFASGLRLLALHTGWITDEVRTLLRDVHDLHLHIFLGFMGGKPGFLSTAYPAVLTSAQVDS
jgi:hypothetical protein